MFELFRNDEDELFSWHAITNIKNARENLGEDVPVLIYRLFQYTMKDVLVTRYGKEEMISIFRSAGKLAGKEFAKNVLPLDLPFTAFIAHLQQVLTEKRMGVLRVEKFDFDTGEATLTIGEDLDCSGLPVTGETVCNYDEGFLAGILKVYTKKDYIVTEVDCWATGSRVCRFKAHRK